MWNGKQGGSAQFDAKMPNGCTHPVSKESWLFKNEIEHFFSFNLCALFYQMVTK